MNLIYPELSYKIIGSAFKVYNSLSFGHKEKYYQRALAESLSEDGVEFEREKIFKLVFGRKVIGKYIADFLVENKIVVELKVRPKIGYVHIKQVVSYLKSSNMKLAIIIYFTKDGVKYRRVVNEV